MTETLQQIWERLAKEGYETDKGSVHSYVPVYEQVLAPYRETAKNVLEIGLFNGHSLRMWEQYFTQSKVYGIDCDEQPHGGLADLRPMIAEGCHHIFIGDAESEEFVHNIFNGIRFDIIIEDAAHNIEQQLKLYSIFKNYLAEGGMYLCEDVQDLDKDFYKFENIDPKKVITILDLRLNKNRYDDVIIAISDK